MSRPVLWDAVTRGLMQRDNGLHPWEILGYTFPELAIKSSEARKRTFSGGELMSDREVGDYCEWYWGLGNAERLEMARRGEL